MIDQSTLSKESKAALHALARHRSIAHELFNHFVAVMDEDGWVMIKQTQLSEDLQYATVTIQKNIEFLKKNRFLDSHRVGSDNVYRLNRALLGIPAHKNRFDPPNSPTIERKKRRR